MPAVGAVTGSSSTHRHARFVTSDATTGGDLRRTIDKGISLSGAHISDLMNRTPKTINDKALAAEALKMMEDLKITALVVRNDQACPVGVLHMHDLLRAGVV